MAWSLCAAFPVITRATENTIANFGTLIRSWAKPLIDSVVKRQHFCLMTWRTAKPISPPARRMSDPDSPPVVNIALSTFWRRLVVRCVSVTIQRLTPAKISAMISFRRCRWCACGLNKSEPSSLSLGENTAAPTSLLAVPSGEKFCLFSLPLLKKRHEAERARSR